MVKWESTTIGKLLEFKNGLNKGKEFFGEGTPIINYMDVYKHRGMHGEQLCGRVTLSAEEIKRFDVHKGDVFFTRTSETPEEVGFASVMLDEIDDCVFSGFVLRGRPITNRLDIDYCQYAFMTEDIRKAIMSSCTFTTRALTNGKQLSAIEIRLPQKPEQQHIAEALSDTDALINAMEKLIAKKRAIKQGTMQELLTGKRRLPGFGGEWVEKPLNELFNFFGGLSASRAQLSDKGYPYLHYGDIHGTSLTYVNCCDRDIPHLEVDIGKVSSTSLLNDGDVVFVDASEDDDGASRHVVVRNCGNHPFISGLHTIIAKSKSAELDNLFKEFCFQTLDIKAQFKYYAVGTKVKGVNKVSLGKIILRHPKSPLEQHHIATILSDMDTEIYALTTKLTKLRNIKQGMMNELLTGRIRLVEPEATIEADAPLTAAPVKVVPTTATAQKSGHSQQFDDAVMIAGIVDALYSNKYPLGRKKVQKCLYLLRRHQDESTVAFKKKAAGPYADEVRYKGGEPIARGAKYISTKTEKGKGTTFARGENISQALGYIQSWGKQGDIKWITDKLKFKKVDELELLATVDMAICDLEDAGTLVSVATIKNLITTNAEWKAKLEKQTFSDANIACAIQELQTLLRGGK